MFLAWFFRLYDHFRGIYEEKWLGEDHGRLKWFPFGLLKIGRDAIGPEADTLKFIRKHTSIPVPRVFVSTSGFGSTYMLMEWIDGKPLEYVWPELDTQQRAHVVFQLRDFVSQLRNLQPPPSVPSGAVCSLHHKALKDSRVASYWPLGPFSNESAFNDRLIVAAQAFMDEGYTSSIRARMRNDHRIVFTHGDLTPRNILVRGDVIVAIVDWEESGWYPEHWELVKARWCTGMQKDDGWNNAVWDILSHEHEKDWMLDRELSDRMVGAF